MKNPKIQNYFIIITEVDLITALTESPSFRTISSTASFDTMEVSFCRNRWLSDLTTCLR